MAEVHNSFISVVGVLNAPYQVRELSAYLTGLYGVLSRHFTDYEIVLVNNAPSVGSLRPTLAELPAELRPHVYLLNLSRHTNRNHAFLAGMDRANGDYTVLFELQFKDRPGLVLDLYARSREGFDMVYLRAGGKKVRHRYPLLYRLFYFILKNYSTLKLDERAHNTRIISRRALNSLLRLRENLRYMKPIYSLVGYKTSTLEVDTPLHDAQNVGFGEQFRTSLVAITSFTTFLRSLLLWIFGFSILFLGVVIVNAVKVRLTNYDLFGDYHQAVSGWTFLVVLISIFFAITCLNLYIMSIYLSNIYQEMKQRPLYIIESVERP